METFHIPDRTGIFAKSEDIFARADGTPDRAIHSIFVVDRSTYPDLASARAGRSVKMSGRPHPSGPPLMSDMGGKTSLPEKATYRQELVFDAVRGIRSGAIHPEEIDPVHLFQTQNGVGISGVQHYVHNWDYWETGKTYADPTHLGNRIPIVYERTNPGMGHRERFLLSGHHRAAAALGLGVPLMGHVIHAP